jgi:hypothetical protein
MRSVYLSGVALAVLAVGCTIVSSGPAGPGYVSSGTAELEVNVNRVGSDYRSFEVVSGRPEECRDTCLTEPQCVAFTFVNPGVQGPNAMCWLKSAISAPTPDNCCVSGVKSAPPPTAGDAAPPPGAERPLLAEERHRGRGARPPAAFPA